MNADAHVAAARRDRIMGEIVARTGIDAAMIERLVRTFYAGARHDPLIGPIFERHVRDWEAHFARMCDFWSSVALMNGRYHGQPMAAHLPLPIDTPHFNRWLELFAQAAQEVCPPAAAAHFIERAHRIADSLELGIAAQRGEIRSRPTPARQHAVRLTRDCRTIAARPSGRSSASGILGPRCTPG